MLNICIVGASGLVGRAMLNEIENMDLGEITLDLFASSRSAGNVIETEKGKYTVKELNKDVDFGHYNIALFSAGKGTSLEYAPLFAGAGCYVVDNSSAWRRDESIPLLAMGVNLTDLKNYESKIIANPNCSTIQSVIPLKLLSEKYVIKDIDYVTYQSVSGSGVAGIRDLELTNNGEAPQNYPHPIANNIIPQIDSFLDDNYTYEEEKMIFETQKILGVDSEISATCVRVPVRNSHAVQMRIEFAEEVSVDEIKKVLAGQPHLEVLGDRELPMPLAMKGERHVCVGRIKAHRTNGNVIFMMSVADNLLVGAATNACEIARYLVQEVLC